MFDGFGYDRVLGVFTDADFGFVCLCFRGSGLTVVVFFFLDQAGYVSAGFGTGILLIRFLMFRLETWQ